MIPIYSIYLIRNKVNQKVYIGFTKDFVTRIYQHLKYSENKSDNYHIHHAIRKYGISNFTFEVIYESYDRDHTLEVMEPYFIKLYDSYDNGYNLTSGGKGPYKRIDSKKTRKLKSKSQTGRKHSEESKAKTFAATASQYQVTYIDGNTQVIKGLAKFCREFKYNRSSLLLVINGSQPRHKDITKVIRLN